jgi:allantoinase
MCALVIGPMIGGKMTEKLVSGGSVVLPNGTFSLDILIQDGRISGLVEQGLSTSSANRIDATGLVVLPGAIDGHTHFFQQDPEAGIFDATAVEGFTKGGSGAAAGGVTSVVEMPQAIPPTINGTTFFRKRNLSAKEAVVDFAQWGGVVPKQPAGAVMEQVAAGAVGFKAYLCNDDPDFPALDDYELKTTLELLKDSGLMLGLHCENEALNRRERERLQGQGRTDPLAFAESRPVIHEVEAINRVIFFAEKTGGWAHIVHMSSPDGAELVLKGKNRGVRITAETCPQYLALDLDDQVRLGPYAKCAPPLRSRQEADRMWDYLADGTIDCITSDHCSWSKASKDAGYASIWKAPNGLTGVQTLLPVVASEARQRGFSWTRIAQWTSEIPARLWHLGRVKGNIRVGGDADLVLIDPDREWVLQPDDILHTEHWSPFIGKKLLGRVVRTLVRGETVFQEGAPEKILVKPGYGRFIEA